MDELRRHYEALPYPARAAADEDRRLIEGSPSRLFELLHWGSGGRVPNRPLRVLVAGGGTGDALVMMAQQAHEAGIPLALTYCDLSGASRAIAEARLARRGLGGVTFRTASLFDAPEWGPFDYIDCCGVLHHLEAPEAGLGALTAALAPQGAIGLMVYATLGRSGVYDVQDVLRTLAPQGEAIDRRLQTARRLIGDLPETNRLRRNPFVSDHESGDAGLYDLLLHSRDRSYLAEELGALVEGAGLRVAGFIEPLRYRPETYLRDPVLRAKLRALKGIEAAALAERLAGNMRKHVVYAVRADNPVTPPGPGDPAAVPVWLRAEGPQIAASLARRTRLRGDFDGAAFEIAFPADAGAWAARFDGSATLSAIAGGPVQDGLSETVRLLIDLGVLALRLR